MSPGQPGRIRSSTQPVAEELNTDLKDKKSPGGGRRGLVGLV